jgi:Raf kinase inhibitor-like YbhB/YbcL family protein
MGSEDEEKESSATLTAPQRSWLRRFFVPCTVLTAIVGVTLTVFLKVGMGIGNPFPKMVVDYYMSDSISFRSAAFKFGEKIPKTYTADSDNVSPPLTWSHVTLPEFTKSLVLIVEDIDVAGGNRNPFVHWVLYDIPADVFHGLPQHIKSGSFTEKVEVSPRGTMDAVPILQGVNSFGSLGYRGPEPPFGMGAHRYFFRLYAIDGVLGEEAFESPPTRSQLLSTMYSAFTVLGKGTLMGTYERASDEKRLLLGN